MRSPQSHSRPRNAPRRAGISPARRPSAEERARLGRAARAETPRSSHSELDVARDRDALALLERQARSRVAELVPIRYGRMLASPLAYFRGAAVVMADDLASTAATGLTVQLSGDAHLLNFGGFASPERDLVFDLNDFDETLPGPFEWDVKRLATSFEIAGRERGFAREERASAVLEVVRAYRATMRQLSVLGDLDVWYARLDAREILAEVRDGHDRRLEKALRRSVAKTRQKDGRHALARLTCETDGERRFRSEPPLLVPVTEVARNGNGAGGVAAEVASLLEGYRRSLPGDRRVLFERFRFVDLARKVVGIGSVGTRCWVVLLLGRDEYDPLFLQVKEAEASVLEPRFGESAFPAHGQRVVEGQRMMQAASDIFLGWSRAARELEDGGRDFYVRQLRDWKSSVDLETILPRGLLAYARACGWTLARAHARSGDRIAIDAYLGSSDRFDRAVARFASAYADRNERDHRALVRAVAAGRVSALEDV